MNVSNEKVEFVNSANKVVGRITFESVTVARRVLTSQQTDERYTPPDLIAQVRRFMGRITLDPASSPEAQRIVQADHFFTKDNDGLSLPWNVSDPTTVFLNPPYNTLKQGKSTASIWAQKLLTEWQRGHVQEACLLVYAAFGYKWFNDLYKNLTSVVFEERLRFVNPDGTSDGQAKKASALFYLGPRRLAFTKEFCSRGFTRVEYPKLQIRQ